MFHHSIALSLLQRLPLLFASIVRLSVLLLHVGHLFEDLGPGKYILETNSQKNMELTVLKTTPELTSETSYCKPLKFL